MVLDDGILNANRSTTCFQNFPIPPCTHAEKLTAGPPCMPSLFIREDFDTPIRGGIQGASSGSGL